MERIYFISDAHLGAHSPEIEKLKITNLISFFTAIQDKADLLYIVGDLFDFWFEYRKAIPKVNLTILFKLQQLVESGVKINYFTGNHDLWLRGYLTEEIGVEIFREPLKTKHNTLDLYIAHGDGLAKGDRVARILQRIFKNRLNIFLYGWLHPDIGIPLAKLISKKSKEKGENPFDEDYRQFALAKLHQGFDGVILGHTHKPLFEKINAKFYVNLGDWIEHFTYLELIGTHFELKTWTENEL
ncbi:MAG: UDP-2,3-diacylglucosamine diphosphatase [bacterium]